MASIYNTDLVFWRKLLAETRQFDNISEKRKAEIVSIAQTFLAEPKPDLFLSVKVIAAKVLYAIDQTRGFCVVDLNNLPLLSGYLYLIETTVQRSALCLFFNDILFEVDYLNVFCLERIAVFLKSNSKLMLECFELSDCKKIIYRLITLWCSGMSVVDVKNTLTITIANALISFMCNFRESILEVLTILIENVPYYVKAKYTFLYRLLDAVNIEEIDNECLTKCYSHLHCCLSNQKLASTSAPSMHSLAQKLNNKNFLSLFYWSITSSNRSIQSNACRLWLPKLKANSHFFPQFFCLLNERLLEKFFCEEDDSSNADCKDYKTNLLWTPKERIAFAWICVFKFVSQARQFEPQVLELKALGFVLRSRQHAIKLRAMDVLLNDKTVLWKNYELSTELLSFIVANFKSDNVDIRECIVSAFQKFNLVKQKLEILSDLFDKFVVFSFKDSNVTLMFLKLLDLTILSMNSNSVTEVSNPESFKNFAARLQSFFGDCLLAESTDQSINPLVLQIVYSIFNSTEQTMFDKAGLLSRILELKDHVKSSVLLDITELFLRLGHSVKNFGVNKHKDLSFNIALESLCIKFDQSNLVLHVNKCIALNDSLLRVGGSPKTGECLNVSRLNSYFANYNGHNEFALIDYNPDEHEKLDEEYCDAECQIFWSKKQKCLITNYANSLIQACKSLRTLAVRLSNEYDIERVVWSIWAVLLRTHHKGVLQKCAEHFDKLLKCLSQVNRLNNDLPLRIINETLKILLSNECDAKGVYCKSRDLAFAEIFASVCSQCNCEQNTNQLIEDLLNAYEAENTSVDTRAKILFILRRFLQSSNLNLSILYPKICSLLLRLSSQTTDWKCFSMICSTFVAFIDALFNGLPEQIPLVNFVNSHPDVSEMICVEIIRISGVENNSSSNFANNLIISPTKRCASKFLPLLLAILERLIVLNFPFENKTSKRFAKRLFPAICLLFNREVSAIVKCQALNILFNFIPNIEHDRIKKILSRRLVNRQQICIKEKTFNFDKNVLIYTKWLNQSHQTSIPDDYAYESVSLLRKMYCDQKTRSTKENNDLKSICQNSRKKNVMKRIEAVEMLAGWFRQHKNLNSKIDRDLLADDDGNKIFDENNFSNFKIAASALLDLLEDEVEEIRLVASKCSLYFNVFEFLNINDNLLEALDISQIPLDSYNFAKLINFKLEKAYKKNLAN